MGISKLFGRMTKYISEAVARIFGPNDDSYPATGVQPFEGVPFEAGKNSDW
jgi:hypothetical protein